MSNLVHCVIFKNVLYSNRMEIRLENRKANGIYSVDMDADDFLETLQTANIDDAIKYFRKSSKINIIRGISFHDGIVPENPVSFKKIPIKVEDATYDEFEEVEMVFIRDKVCYFIQTLNTCKAYPLMDLKEALNSKKKFDLDSIKGITPEMRIVYMFHLLERQKKELEEPVAVVKNLMEERGAKIQFVRKNNLGFEVQWQTGGHTINTQLNKDFRVMEAGFCISGHDRTQSATSVVNLLRGYAENGSHINIMRTPRNI